MSHHVSSLILGASGFRNLRDPTHTPSCALAGPTFLSAAGSVLMSVDNNGTFIFNAGKVDFSPERKVVPGVGPNFFPPKSSEPGSVGDADYSPLVHIKNAAKGVIFNAPMLAFNVNEDKLNEFCNGDADHRLTEDKVIAICPRDGR
jgi:hypothetical protein